MIAGHIRYWMFWMASAVCLVLMSSNVWALSVDEAYRAIPHRRTVFIPQQSAIPAQEKAVLVEFFDLIDQAIVERVEMTAWLYSNGERGRSATRYNRILEQIDGLDMPIHLQDAQHLVRDAIENQQTFLDEWRDSRNAENPTIATDPQVQEASQKLHEAYQILMNTYPSENEHNKNAFFDYLCALDFI